MNRWGDDDAVDAELDDDDATKDVFVALASTSTETRTSETADTDNSSNAILLRLDLIWPTMRSYTIIRAAVNQPRFLRYLCVAMEVRAEHPQTRHSRETEGRSEWGHTSQRIGGTGGECVLGSLWQ